MYRLLNRVTRIIDEIQRQSRELQRTNPKASELLYQASLGLDDAQQMLLRAQNAHSLTGELEFMSEARNLLYAEQRQATPQGQYGELPQEVCHWLAGLFCHPGCNPQRDAAISSRTDRTGTSEATESSRFATKSMITTVRHCVWLSFSDGFLFRSEAKDSQIRSGIDRQHQ